ncbi:hypothetical protein ACWFMI_16070 [Nocardiopsis terrae]
MRPERGAHPAAPVFAEVAAQVFAGASDRGRLPEEDGGRPWPLVYGGGRPWSLMFDRAPIVQPGEAGPERPEIG